MIDFAFEQNCYHCASCEQTCPAGAITMEMGEDTFLYPHISENLCIHCGKCTKVCPHLNAVADGELLSFRTCFAAVSENKSDRIRSASGGVFFELAKHFLSKGYYIAGCVWDDGLHAKHVVTNKIEIVKLMQGSKYVWSDTSRIYKEIKELLHNGERVFFSGMPCQIAALNNYCRAYGEQIISCSLICHGNSSPQLLEYYLDDSKAKGKPVADINFRYHENNEENRIFIRFNNGKSRLFEKNELTYMRAFYEKLCGSICCEEGHCQYKGDSNKSDFIIGDYWGYRGPINYSNVSAVICSSRGAQIISDVATIEKHSVLLADIVAKNPYLLKGAKHNQNRSSFISMMKNDGFSKAYRKYGTMTLVKNIMYKCKLASILSKIR